MDFDIADAEGTRSSMSTPTCDSSRRSTSVESRSCVGATTSPMAPTGSVTSTPGCSSSRSCAAPRPSSFRCCRKASPTRSTSTSPTPEGRSSRDHPACATATRRPTGARRCSADRRHLKIRVESESTAKNRLFQSSRHVSGSRFVAGVGSGTSTGPGSGTSTGTGSGTSTGDGSGIRSGAGSVSASAGQNARHSSSVITPERRCRVPRARPHRDGRPRSPSPPCARCP